MVSFIYVNFGKKLNIVLVEQSLRKHLWYEKLIVGYDNCALLTLDTADGGIASIFSRHICLEDDDWALSALYEVFKDLGCGDTGHVVLSELQKDGEKKSFYDVAFKFSDVLYVREECGTDIKFRKDLDVSLECKEELDGILYSKFKLSKPIFTQVLGDESIKYIEEFKDFYRGYF